MDANKLSHHAGSLDIAAIRLEKDQRPGLAKGCAEAAAYLRSLIPDPVTQPGNTIPLGDMAAEPDPVLVEHLQRLLTMAETGVLRWFYAVGQTSNRCQVVHAGGDPIDAKAAYYAIDRAHDCLAIKAGIGHAEKNT